MLVMSINASSMVEMKFYLRLTVSDNVKVFIIDNDIIVTCCYNCSVVSRSFLMDFRMIMVRNREMILGAFEHNFHI